MTTLDQIKTIKLYEHYYLLKSIINTVLLNMMALYVY
jgi:hypothetical protein